MSFFLPESLALAFVVFMIMLVDGNNADDGHDFTIATQLQ